MKPYVIGYNSNNYIYDLFAVCNHSGNQFGGHYHSHIKNTNGKWYNFDDTDVNEISINKVISSKSYCLFYRRRTN
jgi:ubiquitin carboxyl-terminal hydrolase 31